jgi:hypothetical protein
MSALRATLARQLALPGLLGVDEVVVVALEDVAVARASDRVERPAPVGDDFSGLIEAKPDESEVAGTDARRHAGATGYDIAVPPRGTA